MCTRGNQYIYAPSASTNEWNYKTAPLLIGRFLYLAFFLSRGYTSILRLMELYVVNPLRRTGDFLTFSPVLKVWCVCGEFEGVQRVCEFASLGACYLFAHVTSIRWTIIHSMCHILCVIRTAMPQTSATQHVCSQTRQVVLLL